MRMIELLKKTVRFFIKEKVLLFLVVVFVLTSFLSKTFFSVGNISNLLTQVGLYGIIALGMTFAIIGGEFDLSVGSMISLSTVLVVILYTIVGLPLAIILTLAASLALGLVNGLLVAKANINSFIVTFGGMVSFKGIALTVANGVPVPSRSETLNSLGELNIFGVSIVFFVFLILLVICHLILTYTRYGRNVYAIGGNALVARTTGINVDFYKASLFVITLFMAAIAGVFFAARLNTGHPTIGDDVPLTTIACVVIGGTSLAGGKGNVFRTLLGVFVMMTLSNAFDSMVIQPYFQRIIKGSIIVIVVAFDSYNKRKNKLGVALS